MSVLGHTTLRFDMPVDIGCPRQSVFAIALQPSDAKTTLHQRETIRPRWPLSWFPRQVERTLRKQLGMRLAEIKALAETESRHHVPLGR